LKYSNTLLANDKFSSFYSCSSVFSLPGQSSVKKTDKKYEKAIRAALTEACDIALDEVPGFKWLTHKASYSRFPDSLSVVCIFDTKSELASALLTQQDGFLRSVIREKLSAVGITLKDMARQVSFDTEEACTLEHGGRWQERLR